VAAVKRTVSLALTLLASATTSITVTAFGNAHAQAAPSSPVRQSSMNVSPSRDAWYATSPACGLLPAGCASTPTLTSYPSGTLHVGATSGQEAARSYLTFSSTAVPTGTTVLDAQLIMPVAQDAGTSAADIALLELCAVPRGLPNPPPSAEPAADCTTLSAATYVAESPPYFTADLAPLLRKHGGTLNGLTIAVVPQPVAATAAASDTWHVAFSGASRKGTGVVPIVAQLDVTVPVDTPSQLPEQPAVSAPPAVVGLPPISAPTLPPQAIGPPPQVLPQGPLPTRPQPVAFIVRGHRYGLVWGAPLALFLLGWAFVTTSRKDLRSYVQAPTGAVR
jgi:hypothetical protein